MWTMLRNFSGSPGIGSPRSSIDRRTIRPGPYKPANRRITADASRELGPGADPPLGLQDDPARLVLGDGRRLLVDPLAAGLAVDARRAGVDEPPHRTRQVIEDVLQAVDVDRLASRPRRSGRSPRQ